MDCKNKCKKSINTRPEHVASEQASHSLPNACTYVYIYICTCMYCMYAVRSVTRTMQAINSSFDGH